MTPSERQELMEKADNKVELLAYACDISEEQARAEWDRINELEEFFSQWHGRAKPKKMALTYVMTRYDHTSRTVAYWWGEKRGLSENTAQKYLSEIRMIVDDEAGEYEERDVSSDSEIDEYSEGYKVYESSKDPIKNYFGI